MGFNGSVALAVFWGIVGAVFAAYVLLFVCARRPVSLRLQRIGIMALTVLCARLVLQALGPPLAPLDGMLAFATLLLNLATDFAPRLWLVRTEAATLREQIQTACRGLFLQCEEAAPGDFRLTAKTGAWRLRLRTLGRRLQLVNLPRPERPGKAALLIQWLSKQYPGPVPRLRIVLNKG